MGVVISREISLLEVDRFVGRSFGPPVASRNSHHLTQDMGAWGGGRREEVGDEHTLCVAFACVWGWHKDACGSTHMPNRAATLIERQRMKLW